MAAKVDGGVVDGLAFFGFDVDGVKPETDEPAEVVCEVWECNWASLDFFCAVGTQWTTSIGLESQRLGLNYAGCESAARALGLRWRECFGDLQVMERAVLQAESKERARRAAQAA